MKDRAVGNNFEKRPPNDSSQPSFIKFFTVIWPDELKSLPVVTGTTSALNSILILPTSLLSILMSKNTWGLPLLLLAGIVLCKSVTMLKEKNIFRK